jgi:hypothetical protein
VIVAADAAPVPGGPPCATEGCTPAVIVHDIAGAIVSDATEQVTRMFSRGRVAAPTP